jgi:cytochrome b561
LQSARLAAQFGQKADPSQHFAPALGGFALIALLVLLLRLLWREARPAPVLPQAAPVAD